MINMAYPKEIKEYAKQLFLEVGPEGDHQHTFQEIRDIICQKFDTVKNLKRQTIQQWSTSKDKVTNKSWVDLWNKGQRHGVQKARDDVERQLQEDEKIELHIDSITRSRAQRAIRLCELPDKKLKENKNLELIDIKQIQLSENIFNNLSLESGIEEESSGLSDLAIALQNSRKENKKTNQKDL